jgi:hypothetical protein
MIVLINLLIKLLMDKKKKKKSITHPSSKISVKYIIIEGRN